jgi:hypothetical protein
MSIASSGAPDSVYVYRRGDIYIFCAGGSYQKLVHVDRPVLAIVGHNERIYFSMWDKIITWKLGEAEPSVILNTKLNVPITSLAIDPDSGVLYFASGEGVFALAENEVVMVMARVTGDLLFADRLSFQRLQLRTCRPQGRNTGGNHTKNTVICWHNVSLLYWPAAGGAIRCASLEF